MARSNFFLSFVILISHVYVGHAQNAQYFVQFKDKDCTIEPQLFLSSKALKRRVRQGIVINYTDFPVSPTYITAISNSFNVKIQFASKWLNGVLLECDKNSADSLLTKEFVSKVQLVGSVGAFRSTKSALMQSHKLESLEYGTSIAQIQNLEADQMHEAGFTGRGIFIAIFDGGFTNADQLAAFSPLFQEKRIRFTYNIVDAITNVYTRNTHGTNVFSCLAAYSPGNLIGTGFGAYFALFISEDVNSEKLIEEYNWLRAAEMADSLGVDIISSSLGYNTFDNSADNHTLSQLNGHTTVITKAAQEAARKGIIVVNSAGNNYTDATWPNIVFPCDADSILAVGAVNANGTKASFSAVGSTSDGRIKPDVSALGVGIIVNSSGTNFSGASGTSYSAPLVAGLAAGLWQSDTTLTNIQLINYIKQSASLYCTPNNDIGSGVPKFSIAYQLIKDKQSKNCASAAALKDDYLYSNTINNLYPNPVNDLLNFEVNDANTEKNVDYQLVDISGREVMTGTLTNPSYSNLKLDLGLLKSGIYFLKINQKSYKVTKL